MWSVCSTTGSTSTPGEAGLPAALVVERADPHQPVGARLDAERAVGVGRLHREGGRLQARLLGVRGLVDLGRVAVPLRPAQVHPQQHLGEVRGVHAAGAGPDGDQRLPRVVLAGEQGADLHLLDGLGQPGDLATRPRPARPASASASASSSSTWASSSRRRRLPSLLISPLTYDSCEVTCWALAWSSHRSGAEACLLQARPCPRAAGRGRGRPRCFAGWRRVP